MDPISKTDLAALRAQKKLDEKNAYVSQLVKDVYNVVTAQARDTDFSHVTWCFARFSNLAEFPDIKDEVLAQLNALFPECDITYILPVPDDSIHGQASHIITVNWGDERHDPAPAPSPGPVYPPVPNLAPTPTENGTGSA